MKQLCFLLIVFSLMAHGQSSPARYASGDVAVGDHRGSFSLSYWQNWHVGKKQKMELGIGARFTSFFGANVYYATAPAKLTSGSTGPLVIFKENITGNIDSLLVKSPQVNALNLMINIGYRINSKVGIGFNIDALGFSFGGKKQGNYINGKTGQITSGKPTSFNVLLVSDNDRGTLNSEGYVSWLVNERWLVRMGAQFIFTEYTTHTPVQLFPEQNDRFRNKSLMFSVGTSYILQK